METRNIVRCSLCGMLLALLAVPAKADTEYCVGTPAQFQAALDQAEVDGDDSLVKVRSGTYNLASDLRYHPELEWTVVAGKLTIRGGYNAGCSSYSLAAGATTINGAQHSLFARTVTSGVSIAGITMRNGFIRAYSPVLSTCPPPGPFFAFRRVHVENGSLDVIALCHDVFIENTLVVNGIAVPDAGWPADTAIGVYLNNDEDFPPPSSLTMTNSTVVNGRVDIDTCCDYIATARFYNNILDRPAGSEIFSEAHVLAMNNRYDGLVHQTGGTLLPGSANNTAANPQLNANHVPIPGSAMINSGTAGQPGGLPSTDLAGSERVIGSGVDRGALESPVNGTGTYVVSNTNASGNGSLAQAVELANAEAGFNTIQFNIPGGICPRRINLAGPLQIRESVGIDGWSQPGSVKNSDDFGFNAAPCVVLNGGDAVGIGIEAMAQIGTGRITVRGLAFEGFNLAIALPFGKDHAVYGNQFGGFVSGVFGINLSGNAQAIGLIGSGRTTIGGTDPSSRNLIGGSSDVGVLITTFLGGGGDDNEVINNLIGLNKNGTSALANGTGIRINGGFNLVQGNRIGGNTSDGILLSGESAEGNIIRENAIGGGLAACSLIGATVGNGRMGVMIQSDAHDNQVGPDNVIGCNEQKGVRVMSTAGGRNRIHGNRFGGNGDLGVDLGDVGVSANDSDPAACSPATGCAGNRGQNFPDLAAAERVTSGAIPIGRPIRVRGTFRSSVGGPYRIELFGGPACDGSGHGEGRRLLHAFDLSIANVAYCPVPGGQCIACSQGNCTTGFSAHVPELEVRVGDVITATATSAGGDTSEFSACEVIVLGNDVIFADDFEP